MINRSKINKRPKSGFLTLFFIGAGIILVIFAGIIDWFGIGKPGFGGFQIVIAFVGAYLMFIGGLIYFGRYENTQNFVTQQILLSSTITILLIVLITSGTIGLLLSFLVLIPLGVLDIFYIFFLRHKKLSLRLYVLSICIWIAIFWGVGNVVAESMIDFKQLYWNAFRPDEQLGWYPKANLRKFRIPLGEGKNYFVSTDQYGHRCDISYPKDKTLDYIIQGDSNVFGFGLEDDQILYKQLQYLRPQISFFNFGVSGYDVNHFYFQYEKFKKLFQIENRIILFNIGNDFTMSALSTAYYIRRPYLEVQNGIVTEVSTHISPVPVQAYDHLFIPKYKKYNYLVQESDPKYSWASIYPDWMLKIPLFLYIAKNKFHPTLSALRTNSEKVEVFYPYWLLLKREEWPMPFSEYADDFPLILDKLNDQHPNTIIILQPMRSQIIEEEYQKAKESLVEEGYRETAIDRFGFNRYMKKVCAEQRIRLLDLTDFFIDYDNPISLFQVNDDHLNPDGIKLCAQVIAELID